MRWTVARPRNARGAARTPGIPLSTHDAPPFGIPIGRMVLITIPATFSLAFLLMWHGQSAATRPPDAGPVPSGAPRPGFPAQEQAAAVDAPDRSRRMVPPPAMPALGGTSPATAAMPMADESPGGILNDGRRPTPGMPPRQYSFAHPFAEPVPAEPSDPALRALDRGGKRPRVPPN